MPVVLPPPEVAGEMILTRTEITFCGCNKSWEFLIIVGTQVEDGGGALVEDWG